MWLNERGHKLGRTTVRDMLVSETYLGHITSGKQFSKRNAHPAIVTQELFDRVQACKGQRPAKNRELANLCMLRTLTRCANCGGAMSASPTRGKQLPDGTREIIPSYACMALASKCDCTATRERLSLTPWSMTGSWHI